MVVSCDKETLAPIDQLPPATQTGADIFACLVDGQAFIDTSRSFNCFYQWIDGDCFFGIGAQDEVNDLFGISIGTTNKTISEGEILELEDYIDGNAWAGATFSIGPSLVENVLTSSINRGELTITKLDFDNRIVSGTFWMDLKNPFTGEIVEIREGRFDTIFNT